MNIGLVGGIFWIDIMRYPQTNGKNGVGKVLSRLLHYSVLPSSRSLHKAWSSENLQLNHVKEIEKWSKSFIDTKQRRNAKFNYVVMLTEMIFNSKWLFFDSKCIACVKTCFIQFHTNYFMWQLSGSLSNRHLNQAICLKMTTTTTINDK